MVIDGKVPRREEAERAVLAAAMMDESLLPQLQAKLAPSDFYFDRHQRIYEAFLELDGEGVQLDLRTTQAKLKQKGDLELVGGLAYLMGLDVDLPDLAGVPSYVEIVRETSVRRRLIEAFTQGYQECLDGGLVAGDALSAAEDRLLELRKGLVGDLADGSMSSIMDEVTDVERHEAPIPTGSPRLDEMLQGGLRRSQLAVVAGRPGMGKTCLATNVATAAAVDHGLHVAVYTLEMKARELGMRELSARSLVPLRRLKTMMGNLGPSDGAAVESARGMLRSSEMTMHYRPSLKPSVMLAEVRSRKRRPDVLVVDYVQLMQSDLDRRGHNTRESEVASISTRLKAAAGELDCAVVLVSQLSRAPELRQDKRPVLSDLRQSGQLEQDADIVLFPFRPKYYGIMKPDMLIVAKQRDGATGEFDMEFRGDIVSWWDPTMERGQRRLA